jgi:hypothetical protein
VTETELGNIKPQIPIHRKILPTKSLTFTKIRISVIGNTVDHTDYVSPMLCYESGLMII